jgi:hypothetical protein
MTLYAYIIWMNNRHLIIIIIQLIPVIMSISKHLFLTALTCPTNFEWGAVLQSWAALSHKDLPMTNRNGTIPMQGAPPQSPESTGTMLMRHCLRLAICTGLANEFTRSVSSRGFYQLAKIVREG